MKAAKKYSYWIQSSKFTAITKFSILFFGILSFIILARMLGPSDFGVWGLFMTISSITETARISLIRNAFIRFTNQTEKHEHAGLQASAFTLSFSVSIVLALCFFGLSNQIAIWLKAPGLDVMLRWYSLALLINTVFAHCEMTSVANMDFRSVTFMYVSRQIILLGIIVFCWLFKITLYPESLAIFYLLSIVGGCIVGLKVVARYLQWDIKSYKKWSGQMWRFGRFVFGTNISSLLFRSTGNFLTSAYISTAASAFYNASTRISNMVDMPSQVLADVAFTKAAQIDSSNKAAIKNMYEKTVGAILTFSIPALLFLLVFPSFVLRVLAGEAFEAAAPILRIAAFFGFILPFLKQYGTIMDATGHPHINFRTNFLAFILNVVFNLLGIYFWGFIGAAIGTAVTYFIIFIITQWILYRKYEISWISVFKNAFIFYGKLTSMVRKYSSAKLLKTRGLNY